jgi:hypothetical protein
MSTGIPLNVAQEGMALAVEIQQESSAHTQQPVSHPWSLHFRRFFLELLGGASALPAELVLEAEAVVDA